MRLPLLSRSDLSPEQRAFYDDMRNGIESKFRGFEAINRDGALIGPWNPWLHFSKFGGPIWELVKALSASPTLPLPVREVAILVTGTHFHAAYELYAHVLVAKARGLPEEIIATIVAGQRPLELTQEETVAFDFASALVSGSNLPELVYRQAVKTFGEDGTAELIYLVGLYCLVSVTLNGFDVPVPETIQDGI
ncbi:carboxymuconolactone decarboxylase family protein [Mesorhizobium mediterraneum]|uniref:carboxymuconolactone decarboxylase family protein n=1 Tax=Mesorhizobium mediterraneum TaxID=43617 RepID=UPI001780E717|nr:carboxymuconolactone decarboxylase family protein [Mesorhizobium mediterraneum]